MGRSSLDIFLLTINEVIVKISGFMPQLALNAPELHQTVT